MGADGFIGHDIDPKNPNEDMLRKSMMAELDAISLYRRFAEKTNYRDLEELFNHVADEEEEHLGEFLQGLREIKGDEFIDNLKKGMNEYEQILDEYL